MTELYAKAIFCALILSGCAADTGVIDAGQGLFFIEKQQATGAPGLGSLRADVYTEARQACENKNLSFSTERYEETKPPYILGNYPRVSLTFRCL